MLISDLFEETFFAVFANKARSGLTILGIVIGIGSVIAMISIGQGTQASIEERIQSIGSNLLMIYPGAQFTSGGHVSTGYGSAQTLTQEDADAIKEEIIFIEAVAPEISNKYQITARGTNTNTSVVGTVFSYLHVRNIEIDMGVFISEQNVKSLSKVAVLGPTARDDLFGEDSNPVGQKIRINRVDFTVIGITETKGGTGFGSQDNIIFIPISTAQRFLSGDDYVSSINIQVQDEEFMTVVQEEVTSLLLVRHNISDPQSADFSIMNQADILETMSAVTSAFTIFLGAIAGISLIVGGIGIMNMMLTTVTERTREIGLRKAIGAKNKDISRQFLIEAVMLTFIGGIIGIIIGWLVSFGISKFADITTSVSTWSIVLAFGVSALIGIGFGYYPAKRAAELNPIEALRYE
jgi:putative ABC transport system permease protein